MRIQCQRGTVFVYLEVVSKFQVFIVDEITHVQSDVDALFVADSAADQSFGMHLCFSDFVIEKESVIVLTVVHHQIGFRFELYGIIFICRFYSQMKVS